MTPVSNRRFGQGIQALENHRPTRPVTAAGGTRSHPIISQAADAFERFLRGLGIPLDDIKVLQEPSKLALIMQGGRVHKNVT